MFIETNRLILRRFRQIPGGGFSRFLRLRYGCGGEKIVTVENVLWRA